MKNLKIGMIIHGCPQKSILKISIFIENKKKLKKDTFQDS